LYVIPHLILHIGIVKKIIL